MSPTVDCRGIGVNFTTTSQDISSISMDTEVDLSSLPKGACSAIRVVIVRVGRTKVTITLETKGFGRLEATTTIDAHRLITVIVCLSMFCCVICMATMVCGVYMAFI